MGVVNIKPDTANSNDLMLIDFGNRNYGALIQGGGNNQGFTTIIPETNVRKAYPESTCVGGVTNSSGSFPSELEIIVPK